MQRRLDWGKTGLDQPGEFIVHQATEFTAVQRCRCPYFQATSGCLDHGSMAAGRCGNRLDLHQADRKLHGSQAGVLATGRITGGGDKVGHGEGFVRESVPGGDAVAADAPRRGGLLACREGSGDLAEQVMTVAVTTVFGIM
ncbi:hypothetical protein GCM10010191_31950 [Actinomadura vinacea]|uniref:SWIM-type domain-containing protein n=1 Tax=Actinomadura vinacea TaxID=115336 RepID=A0ABN3J1W9_9ACTN